MIHIKNLIHRVNATYKLDVICRMNGYTVYFEKYYRAPPLTLGGGPCNISRNIFVREVHNIFIRESLKQINQGLSKKFKDLLKNSRTFRKIKNLEKIQGHVKYSRTFKKNQRPLKIRGTFKKPKELLKTSRSF